MRKTLLIDDNRILPADKICRTYKEGIQAMQEEKFDHLLLDNDLGGITLRESGVGILQWLAENKQHRPKSIRFITSTEYIIPMMIEYAELAGYVKHGSTNMILEE